MQPVVTFLARELRGPNDCNIENERDGFSDAFREGRPTTATDAVASVERAMAENRRSRRNGCTEKLGFVPRPLSRFCTIVWTSREIGSSRPSDFRVSLLATQRTSWQRRERRSSRRRISPDPAPCDLRLLALSENQGKSVQKGLRGSKTTH